MFLRPALLSLTLLLTSAPFAHAAEQQAQTVQAAQKSVIGEYTAVAEQLVDEALSYLGIRYRFGGTSPETGLDCSGLVLNVFRNAVGLDLPRTAREMANVGDKIGRQELKPGDLVFFNTMRRTFSHVGIYLGDGKFVHAPSSGGKVRVESISTRYWAQRFNGARRLVDDGDVLTPSAKLASLR
ncbi:C40 family peptidase [Thauera sp.]|jgi:cell wall-associated NlpC family hydrolase|uniref:C40 family peptidase n=1 Tax=Thauera sp. TaxID=1905334 RepID=UPI002A36921F|nr:C40 family peptidase [Thauera sp.]MDX9885246.1 C40 family peptidase [Thauera sp.]